MLLVFRNRTREPVISTGSLAVYDRSLLAPRRWASASKVQHISNIQNQSKLVTMGLDKLKLSHEVPRFCFVCGQADWTNGFWSLTPLLKRWYLFFYLKRIIDRIHIHTKSKHMQRKHTLLLISLAYGMQFYVVKIEGSTWYSFKLHHVGVKMMIAYHQWLSPPQQNEMKVLWQS